MSTKGINTEQATTQTVEKHPRFSGSSGGAKALGAAKGSNDQGDRVNVDQNAVKAGDREKINKTSEAGYKASNQHPRD